MVKRIREAFPDPVWPADKLVSDEPRGNLDRDYAVRHYQGKRWTELSESDLDLIPDGGTFTDDAQLFFLPAWLIDEIQREKPFLGAYGYLLDGLRERIVDEFTAAQCEILCEVLLDYYWEKGGGSPNSLISDLLALQGRVDTRPPAPD